MCTCVGFFVLFLPFLMPWEFFIESRIGHLYRIIGIEVNRPSVCEFILTFLGGDLCLMCVVSIGTWGFKFL